MDGTPFGRYRLIELLGRGGMGEVWRAYDPTMDRVVALKLLPANFADDRVFQERFRREAKAAAGLDEPHVVPIYEFGEIEGRLYVTMRLIQGRDLQTVLADGPLSPERAVRIIEQVAKALHAAHRIGLIHRDIKPSNILLAEDDFGYLIDFGIARAAGETGLTSTGATIGTWSYMSPERFQSGTADARADIYALACVLYQALTGRVPFPGSTLEQIAVAHMLQPPPRPSREQDGVPAAMDEVIATGMAKNPAERYATAVELARAALDATTVPLPRPEPMVPVHPPTQPGHSTAVPFHVQDTERAAASAAPGLQPPGPPRWQPPSPQLMPAPKRPGWRRPRVVVPAVVAIVVLIGGGVFAAVKVSQRQPTPAAAPPAGKPPPAAGPTFEGTFTVVFGPATNNFGDPVKVRSTNQMWVVRSACSDGGCVATASVSYPGANPPQPNHAAIYDFIDGRWQSVRAVTNTDPSTNQPVEEFQVISLEPHNDGSFSGEYHLVDAGGTAPASGQLTVTRTGDVTLGVEVADPAAQPRLTVSPAQALHGHYHRNQTGGGATFDEDFVGETYCLREGTRCISSFYNNKGYFPLVYAGSQWTENVHLQDTCADGKGKAVVDDLFVYPLPQPTQNPIVALAGSGHETMTGDCSGNVEVNVKLDRTGD